jgi:hypothetical protein
MTKEEAAPRFHWGLAIGHLLAIGAWSFVFNRAASLLSG